MSWLARRVRSTPRIAGLTEAEWLAAQDFMTAPGVFTTPAPARLRLLYFAHLCRQLSAGFEAETRDAVEVAERYAEGQADGAELYRACADAGDRTYTASEARRRGGTPGPYDRAGPIAWGGIAWVVRTEFLPPRVADGASSEGGDGLMAVIPPGTWSGLGADLAAARDLLGNPFRPVPTVRPEWRTPDVIGLARSAYESRDFAALPILADALEESGCDAADLLNHLRSGGVHVRGCWAIELVLD